MFFTLVFEHRREVVERPRMEVEIPVVAPVTGLAGIIILADTTEIANDDSTDAALLALVDDVF